MEKKKYIVPALKVRRLDDEPLLGALSSGAGTAGVPVQPGSTDQPTTAKHSLFDNDYEEEKGERSSRWY